MSNVAKIGMYKAITEHGKAETKASGLLALVVDGAISNKIGLGWWKAPGKEAEPLHSQHWERTNAAIVKAFPAAWQKTFATPTKALDEGNKPGQKGDVKNPAPGTKRYIQMQIGSRRGAFERAHKARLEGPVTKGPDQNRTDDKTFCEERLVAIKKRLEKSEDANFDVVDMLTHIERALASLHSNI
jgi:hypothetical protein